MLNYHNAKLRRAKHQPVKKSAGLFAQRGAGWIAGGSIGQSALFWLLFWASKKVTRRYKENTVQNRRKANPQRTLTLLFII